MRVIIQQGATTFQDVRASALLRPNYLEFVTKGVTLPMKLARLARSLVRDFGSVTAVDLVTSFAESLPSGLYSSAGIARYVKEVLSDPDRTDDFRELGNELYLVATDLDTCERIVLGSEGWNDVPISTAVSASCALPMVYKPVKIKDRELIDGGILSTTNLDLAVEAGAKFIVVVNPLVPYVNDFEKQINTFTGSRVRRVSDMGFPHIGYQTFKLLMYQRLHELARRWEQRYPGRRHHPDRARGQRRADVPDERDELHLPGRRRPTRLPVGHAEARQRLSRGSSRSARATASRSRSTRLREVDRALPGRAREDRAPGARSWSRRHRRCYVSPLRTDTGCAPARRRRRAHGHADAPRRACVNGAAR